jgi:hypothetical protein
MFEQRCVQEGYTAEECAQGVTNENDIAAATGNASGGILTTCSVSAWLLLSILNYFIFM